MFLMPWLCGRSTEKHRRRETERISCNRATSALDETPQGLPWNEATPGMRNWQTQPTKTTWAPEPDQDPHPYPARPTRLSAVGGR